jgi:iron(III) transport system ATP-binding protein
LLVTHDQEEAMAFADRLIVMRDGRIEQEGSPERVYAQPRTAFVANFLGRTNLIPGRATGMSCKTIFGEITLESPANGPIMLSIRPEDLKFAETNGLNATVIAREFKGHDITYALESDGLQLIVQTDHTCALNVGDCTQVRLEGPAIPVRGSE